MLFPLRFVKMPLNVNGTGYVKGQVLRTCPVRTRYRSRHFMRHQTRGEEIANSITHGIGAALSVAALVILIVFSASAGDGRRIASLSIYGATLIFLYLASTFYHGVSDVRTKRVFRIIDHSSIYLLIA